MQGFLGNDPGKDIEVGIRQLRPQATPAIIDLQLGGSVRATSFCFHCPALHAGTELQVSCCDAE